MPKKIIVHLGANKTGSSAIQQFVALNTAALRSEGIVVPDSRFRVTAKVEGFQVFGFEELFRDPQGRERLEAAVETIWEQAPDASTILLSAENLAANPDAPKLFKRLATRYDVRLVIYIRRQDDYILSTWQQWNSKITTDFWAWATSVIGNLGNWRVYLQNWECVVPREQIFVRIFERGKLVGGDVIADYLNCIRVAPPIERFAYPQERVNPSFSDAVMDLVKGNPLIFKDVHDNHFYNLVLQLTGDRHVKNQRQSSITFAQRKALMGRYSQSNNWVRDAYFPDEPVLFSAPREQDYTYVSADSLLNEKLEFLTSMMYQVYKKASP